MATKAPSFTKWSAIPRPMPCTATVTIAILPSSLIGNPPTKLVYDRCRLHGARETPLVDVVVGATTRAACRVPASRRKVPGASRTGGRPRAQRRPGRAMRVEQCGCCEHLQHGEVGDVEFNGVGQDQ